MNRRKVLMPALMMIFVACNEPDKSGSAGSADSARSSKPGKGSYGYDAAFLKEHTTKVLELTNASGQSKVLLSADYQGRVMTSTARGNSGTSYGWINYELISAPQKKSQFNPVGGEERFWLGPEGGQYSIYFKGKDSFNFAHWQVPAVIDTLSYNIMQSSRQSATFTRRAEITNYSGTKFQIEIQRNINLLSPAAVAGELKMNIDTSVSMVAYTTENLIRNIGSEKWKKETGLLSIWLLAMLTPSDQTKVIIPFIPGTNAEKFITRDYFGPIPPERLTITDSFLVLNCDGKYRSKIGIAPAIAKPVAGSFDFEKNILTITMFSVNKQGSYVNSKWELQKEPYKGDAVNAYNDGPLTDGTQMGPFYEIESSSPALELQPGGVQVYRQSTFHFEGDYEKLEALARRILGISLNDVKALTTSAVSH